MVSNEMKELMANGLFSSGTFEQIWTDLNQIYEQLGFQDKISDEQKIKEYKYIAQQFRKYIGSKKSEVLGCESIEDMCGVMENLILNQREYGDIRADIAYNVLRDHWLAGVYNVLTQMAVQDNGEEEDE